MVVEKPWGKYELLKLDEGYWIKTLTIFPNCRFSLQYHKNRDEHWIVLRGKGCVAELAVSKPEDIESYRLKEGDSLTVQRGTIHRIWNHSEDQELEICEIAFGEPDENDIVRIQDDWGRT